MSAKAAFWGFRQNWRFRAEAAVPEAAVRPGYGGEERLCPLVRGVDEADERVCGGGVEVLPDQLAQPRAFFLAPGQAAFLADFCPSGPAAFVEFLFVPLLKRFRKPRRFLHDVRQSPQPVAGAVAQHTAGLEPIRATPARCRR